MIKIYEDNETILLKHKMNSIRDQLLDSINTSYDCDTMSANDYIFKVIEIDNLIGYALLFKENSYDNNSEQLTLNNDANLNFDDLLRAYHIRHKFIGRTYHLKSAFIYTCVFWEFRNASFWLNFDAEKQNEIAKLSGARLPAYTINDYKFGNYPLLRHSHYNTPKKHSWRSIIFSVLSNPFDIWMNLRSSK